MNQQTEQQGLVRLCALLDKAKADIDALYRQFLQNQKPSRETIGEREAKNVADSFMRGRMK